MNSPDGNRRRSDRQIQCPKCGARMRMRTAKRGRYTGREFWGCTRYPACNGIVGSASETIVSPFRMARRLKRRSFKMARGIVVSVIVLAGLSVLIDGVPSLIAETEYLAKDPGDALVGRATVIDGDTIEILGQRVRFNGIDAPESDQTCALGNGSKYRCGQKSAMFLSTYLAASRPTSCNFVEWDRYGRYVGDCYRADGESVAIALVRAGHAVDWPRYSNGAYAQYQAEAKSGKQGMWQGAFVMPWDYRAQKRSNQRAERRVDPANRAERQSGSCNIKGNISVSSGARIYHVPGQEFYDQTQINTSKGERWFCSEAEARAAGWRRARR